MGKRYCITEVKQQHKQSWHVDRTANDEERKQQQIRRLIENQLSCGVCDREAAVPKLLHLSIRNERK